MVLIIEVRDNESCSKKEMLHPDPEAYCEGKCVEDEYVFSTMSNSTADKIVWQLKSRVSFYMSDDREDFTEV
ncbi:hypothetical protein Plhal304r1_c021g0075441 [Plasmopara halstedii]